MPPLMERLQLELSHCLLRFGHPAWLAGKNTTRWCTHVQLWSSASICLPVRWAWRRRDHLWGCRNVCRGNVSFVSSTTKEQLCVLTHWMWILHKWQRNDTLKRSLSPHYFHWLVAAGRCLDAVCPGLTGTLLLYTRAPELPVTHALG